MLKTRVDSGFFDAAFAVFSSMLASGARPDRFTLPLVVSAVWALPNGVGEAVQAMGIQLGFCSNAFFCNSLIDFYVKCEDNVFARNVFDDMLVKDVVSWTTMISSYVQAGDISASSRMFHEMRVSGIAPNSVTLAVVLRGIEGKKDAEGGRQIQCLVMKTGFWCHELVQNCILTVYSKTDCLKEAEKLFYSIEERSVLSWNILMMGYSSARNFVELLEFFRRMISASYPSPQTLTLVISALTKCRDLRTGKQIHCRAVKSGQIDMILQASFLNLYVKCVDSVSSFQLLEEVDTSNNSIPWIVMMWGFVQTGQFRQAIAMFQRLQTAGFDPNVDALRCLTAVFANLGALLPGKAVHGYSIRHQLCAEPESGILETSLINMYAKCGSVVSAQRCFNKMLCRDTVAWTSMIECYAVHGMGLEAMKLFRRMSEDGIRPNNITFLSLLSSCSHAGLLVEGCELFSSMNEKFGIKPELNHFTCIVDLLARSGELTGALNLIHSMDVKPDGRVWGALLSSCRVHQNVSIGDYAARRLFELEPENAGYHIVLSNVYSCGDRWAEVEIMWKSMDEVEFRERPGGSCVEEKGGFSPFVATNHLF